MLLNKTKFSEFVGVSRQGLEKAIKKGRAIVRKDKKINTEHPVNIAYIAKHNGGRNKQPDPKKYKSPGVLRKDRAAKKLADSKKVSTKKRKPKSPKNYESPHPEDNVEIPTHEDLENETDLEKMYQHQLDKLKTIEEIKSKRVKTAKDRDELIPRNMIKAILGHLVMVDTNEFLSLGNSVGSEIAGIMKINDAKAVIKINKLIEKKCYRIMQHKQKLMKKFLKEIEREIANQQIWMNGYK